MNLAIHDLASEIRETFKVDKQSNLPYISLDDIEPHSLSLKSYGSSDEVQSHKYRFKKGDILFGTLRPYFCKLVVCPFDGVCSTEFSVIRPKDDNDRNFLFFTLAQKNFIEHATVNSNGGRPRTSWKLFSGFSVPYFNKKERLKIGEFLSNYSRLIENNCRQIQLLEQSARLIYEEWFIRFRFPGYELTRFIDGLPEGWKKNSASDFLDIMSGGTPKTTTSDYWGGDIPFFTPTDAPSTLYAIDTDKTITEKGIKNCSSDLYPEKTIFITARGTVGKLCLSGCPMAMNQSCYALKGKADFPSITPYWLLFAMESVISIIKKNANGAVFDAIIKDTFKNIPLTLPTDNLILNFTETVHPIIDQTLILLEQSKALAKARNLLLPKLMNGEIQV